MSADGALMPTYARFPVTLERGEGMRVWDDEGRAYLDFTAGIGSASLGHAHPEWVSAVTWAASTLGLVSNLYATRPQTELAARVAELVPIPDARVFFANSGAEANEAALKLVRKHGLPRGRGAIVALEGSFHGRTVAALAATGQPAKRAPFEPLVDWFRFVEAGDVAALERELEAGDVAGLLIEPVLGEGGVIPLADVYLRAARELCDRHDVLLVADEVQAGWGRCGDWLSISLAGVRPDVATLAKGLGGGLPIGACVARADLALGPGDHGSTFGGGPVPCSAALTVLDVIERDGLLASATEQGDRLRAALASALPAGAIKEIRGRGLLDGVHLLPDLAAADVAATALRRGLLVTTAGPDVVRLTPPLIVGPDHVDEAASLLAAAIEEVRG